MTKKDAAAIKMQVMNGKGAMPGGLVSGTDLENVVAYVDSINDCWQRLSSRALQMLELTTARLEAVTQRLTRDEKQLNGLQDQLGHRPRNDVGQ